MKKGDEICTFNLGDLVFGIEVNQIQEVLRYQAMTPVPLTPDVVAGLINLRGQIVTALDLRCRFELPPRVGRQLPLMVVVRTSEGPVSLIVDDVGDVIEVDPAQLEDPPSTLKGAVKDLVHSVLKHQQALILILHVAKTVHVGDDEEDEAA